MHGLEAPAEFPLQQPLRIFVSAGTDHTLLILRHSYHAGKRSMNRRFGVAAGNGNIPAKVEVPSSV
jgi:hypothetical protein